MDTLRQELIKLAQEVPEIRKHVVPLLRKAKEVRPEITPSDAAHWAEDLAVQIAKLLPEGETTFQKDRVLGRIKFKHVGRFHSLAVVAKPADADRGSIGYSLIWESRDHSAPRKVMGGIYEGGSLPQLAQKAVQALKGSVMYTHAARE